MGWLWTVTKCRICRAAWDFYLMSLSGRVRSKTSGPPRAIFQKSVAHATPKTWPTVLRSYNQTRPRKRSLWLPRAKGAPHLKESVIMIMTNSRDLRCQTATLARRISRSDWDLSRKGNRTKLSCLITPKKTLTWEASCGTWSLSTISI